MSILKEVILYIRTNQNHSLSFFISLMTSIVSGFVVAIFLQNDLSIFWKFFGTFLIVLFLIIGILGFFFSRRVHNKIAVVTYIDPSVPFVSSFLSALISELQKRHKTLDVIFDNTKGQIKQLPEDVSKKMNLFSPYMGVILIPHYREPLHTELIEEYGDRSVPLVILDDINRSKHSEFLDYEKSPSIAFIYHSNKRGAFMAAQKAIILEEEALKKKEKVVFLVIGFDSPTLRHEEYISELKNSKKTRQIILVKVNSERSDDMRLVVSGQCERDNIKEQINNKKVIVFCSSDYLTIGFLYYLKQKNIDSDSIDLISYDGTLPIKTLLKINHLPIRFAIEQDVEILSEECIYLLTEMRDKKSKNNIKELDLKVIDT